MICMGVSEDRVLAFPALVQEGFMESVLSEIPLEA